MRSYKAAAPHRAISILLACFALGLGACDKSRLETPRASLPTDAGAVAMVAKTSAPDGAAAPAPDLQVCPGAVAGASTRVKDIVDGVELVIIARDAHATQEIRRRASKLASVRAPGSGGAASGCAIHFVPGAETTIEEVRGGISVTITASSPDAVTGLRKSTRERAAAMGKIERRKNG